MKFFFVIPIIFTLFLIGGCIDEIDFEKTGESGTEPLIILGRIDNGDGPIEVNIRRFFGENVRSVGFAAVKIVDSQGNEETFSHIGNGNYLTSGSTFERKVGESYHIEIVIDDKIYRSEPETIQTPAKITDFSLELTNRYVSEGNFTSEKKYADILVNIDFPETESGPFMRWEIEEGWKMVETDGASPLGYPKTCYFREWYEPQNIFLLNGDKLNSQKVEKHRLVTRVVDWSFADRHVFAFYHHTLTPQAFEFWQNVDLLTDQIGSIFDIIPAGIRGNVYNVEEPGEIVLGYFEAISVDTAIYSLTPSDLAPYRPVPLCLPYRSSYGIAPVPTKCYNCLSVFGSILDRPEFFD